MDILDDMGVSKLSAKVFFFKVNYSFKKTPHKYESSLFTHLHVIPIQIPLYIFNKAQTV